MSPYPAKYSVAEIHDIFEGPSARSRLTISRVDLPNFCAYVHQLGGLTARDRIARPPEWVSSFAAIVAHYFLAGDQTQSPITPIGGERRPRRGCIRRGCCPRRGLFAGYRASGHFHKPIARPARRARRPSDRVSAGPRRQWRPASAGRRPATPPAASYDVEARSACERWWDRGMRPAAVARASTVAGRFAWCGPRMPVTLYTTAAAAVRPTRDGQRLATSPNPRGILPIDPVTRTG